MKRKALGVALLIAAATWASGAAAQSATVQMLAGNCVGCHGVDGTSRGPASPNIAGMSKAYFVGAMLSYKYGKDVEKIGAAAKKLGLDPDDIEGHERLATVMDRIAKGYSDEDIGMLADYFGAKPAVAAAQGFDAALAARGKAVHDKACEKCHEDGGRKGFWMCGAFSVTSPEGA